LNVRWLVVVALLVVSRVAAAHQTSVKYIDLATDGTTVEVTLRVAPGDVTEPMHLPADARPGADEAARAPEVAPYVAAWLELTSFGEPCRAGAAAARPDTDDRFVAVTWRVTCARVADQADFTRFFAVDRKHVAMVRVDGGPAQLVAAGEPQLSLRERPSLFAWLQLGIHHIVDWDGRDHISFVIALLLVVMLDRLRAPSGSAARPGEAGPCDRDRDTWGVRSIGASLRATATVITAFTIAHSVSLISAALGWITLPSRLVETLIAASIAYTAAEDIVRPDPRWRYGLTFGFGLVHGLGFASTLAVQLPPRAVVVPLLCFNVGVEVGQLTIVLVVLPVFYLLAREIGAARYRRVVMPAIAAVLCVAGVMWVIKRALLT
jgi:hypothetical protein